MWLDITVNQCYWTIFSNKTFTETVIPHSILRVQHLHEGQIKSTSTYGLVCWKSKWNQQFSEYLNKRFNVFILHSRIPISLKSWDRTVKQTFGGYISTWGCLFWWSTRNTHNSAGLHYDFRKQVVMLTMSVYLKINKIHLWSLITYWIYIHGWHTEIQTVSLEPADLLLSDMYICVHTHTHINIGKSLRLK